MTPATLDKLLDHCRSLPGASEDVKWGAALVFSVGTTKLKMFAAFGLDADGEPDRSVSFRVGDADFDVWTELDGVIPAPYFAKMGWIKAEPHAGVPLRDMRRLLTGAHALTGATLTKKAQKELGLLDA